MKFIGYILISIGVAVIAFLVFNRINSSNEVVSPIPQEDSIKVINLTPAKK